MCSHLLCGVKGAHPPSKKTMSFCGRTLRMTSFFMQGLRPCTPCIACANTVYCILRLMLYVYFLLYFFP